jgi:hypothetical protein
MALVQQGRGAGAIAAAIGGALARYAAQIGRERLEQLQDELVNDVIMGGRQALGGMQITVQGFIRNNARALGEGANQLGTAIGNSLQNVWRQNRADWENILTNGPQHWIDEVNNEQLTANDPTTLDEMVPEEDQNNQGQNREMENNSKALITQNHMENTSGTNGNGKRPGNGPPEGEPEAQRSAQGGPNSVSKETPISPYPTLSYGLQETHTTILPWTGWLTVACNSSTQVPIQLKLRMNTPYDMVDTQIQTSPSAGAAFTAPGFYGYPSQAGGLRAASGGEYPEQFNAGTSAGERPAWRDFWGAIYDYYTVLGCEYKIVIENPNTGAGSAIMVYENIDTYSDTATSTGNTMPISNQADMLAYKNVKEHRVAPNDSRQNNITIISGQYRPGQAKRNIINDGDVKTWTKTTATLPNLKETLTLNFVRHPMAYGTLFNANIQISLKYIVQFKDLKIQARYPNRATTEQDIVLIMGDDNADSNGLQAWT